MGRIHLETCLVLAPNDVVCYRTRRLTAPVPTVASNYRLVPSQHLDNRVVLVGQHMDAHGQARDRNKTGHKIFHQKENGDDICFFNTKYQNNPFIATRRHAMVTLLGILLVCGDIMTASMGHTSYLTNTSVACRRCKRHQAFAIYPCFHQFDVSSRRSDHHHI